MKRVLPVTAGLLVGIFLLVVWLSFIDTKEVLNVISTTAISSVLLGALFWFLSIIIRSIRWRIVMRKIPNISYPDTILMNFVGNFINLWIPIRAGELAKAYFVKKKTHTPITKTLPTIFIDKLFDASSVIFILPLLFIVQINQAVTSIISIVIALILIALVNSINVWLVPVLPIVFSVWRKQRNRSHKG